MSSCINNNNARTTLTDGRKYRQTDSHYNIDGQTLLKEKQGRLTSSENVTGGREGRGFKEEIKEDDNLPTIWTDVERRTDRQTLWFIGKLHFQKGADMNT